MRRTYAPWRAASAAVRLSIDDIRLLATKPALNRIGTLFRLSDRELAALHAILLGEKVTQTAHRLGIAVSTLKCYRKRAYTKLVVENEIEAAIRITAILVEHSDPGSRAGSLEVPP